MIRHSFFILFLLSGLLSAMAADPDRLCGQVRDAGSGEPVAGAIVKAKGAFATTDREGRFSLSLKQQADSVTFRCLGYEPLTLHVSADFSDVRLNPEATRLKDVIVEAPDIYARGDTLVFNVERYANAKDNAIIDVIRRLPGIKVEEDGTIKYQGKPISKFYLDGNDFIGGRYGLAAGNISHKDVKSVEVLENHQPVKALEGIEFPDEAGINLKLKDDARGRWAGVAGAGAGMTPFLYTGSLFAMRLAPKIQNMFTLKADNTGWNPADEIRDHDLDMMFPAGYISSLWPEYISADMVDAPLSGKRTRDNLSWLADAVSAWKRGDTSMRLRLDYAADRLDYNSGLVADYFSPQIPRFVQNDALHTRSHDLSAQFNSETNKRDFYLKDKLTVAAVGGKSCSSITGTYELDQRVDRKLLSIGNDLKLVRRNEKKLFTLASRNSFVHRPDRLIVAGDEDALQKIGTADFRSTTETRFGKLARFWKYYLTAGVDLSWHRMDSRLTGMGDFDNDGVRQAFLSDLYATPQVDYERNGWRMSLNLPLKWRHYSVAGQHDYADVSASLTLRRQLTAKSELSAGASCRLGSPQPYLRIRVPVLSDYRNLFIADGPDRYTHDAAASLAYRYRNPMKSLFVNLSVSCSYRRSSIMPNQIFVDDFIISTYADRIFHNDTWQLKGGLSKGLGHSRMVVGLDADASVSAASSMRDGTVIPYRRTAVGIKPCFKGSILGWLSASYEAEYGFSSLTVSGERTDIHTLRQNLFATVIPDDRVQLTLGAEHYLTRFPENGTAGIILLDASAVWSSNGRIRLALTADNLLDRRAYRYSSYGTLSRTVHTFRLRPRALLATLQFRF